MLASVSQTAHRSWLLQHRRLGTAILWLGIATLSVAVPISPTLTAQESSQPSDPSLVRCGSTISLDKRLVMEQWGAPGECERPLRTRVTDKFLGFACVSRAGTDSCRSFVPNRESRAFDMAKGFRCVDLAFTVTDAGVAVSRMREWAAMPKQCDWDPSLNILAMEVDFENGNVCVAALCTPVDRLSVIGKVRLRRLITSAFQELNLVAQSHGPQRNQPRSRGPPLDVSNPAFCNEINRLVDSTERLF